MDLLSHLRIVKPWMIQHLLAGSPVVPVFVKASAKEASSFWAEVADLRRRQVNIMLLEQPFHIRKILSIEGHSSAEKHVDDYRGAPNIYLAVVGPLHEYLGRNIARAAQPLREEPLVLRNGLCEPKVSQFNDARLLVDEDVVQLNVSVGDVHPVEIIHRGEQLSCNEPNIALAQESTLLFLSLTHELGHVTGGHEL